MRAGFLAIAANEPERCAVFDTNRDKEEVFAGILAKVESRLGDRLPDMTDETDDPRDPSSIRGGGPCSTAMSGPSGASSMHGRPVAFTTPS